MEVVALQTAGQYLDESCFPHLFFDRRVVADVVEDVETNEEQLVLLPDQHVQLLKLGLGSDPVVLVVAPPHLDVLAVQQVEPLDLVLQHLHDGGPHLVLGEQILKLLVVGQDVEHAEDVDGEVDVALVVLGEGPAEDGEQGIWVWWGLPCSRRSTT